MNTNRKLAVALTMGLLCGWLAPSGVYARGSVDKVLTGVVTKVSDGDTVWVRPAECGSFGACKEHKVRVLGIDAPETCQVGGAQSAEALRGRVLHQTVEIRGDSRDIYGRDLGRVILGGDDVGAWMVRQGYAWSYRYRNSGGPYVREEQEARQNRRGVFADPSAIEPRSFRKSHGSCHHDSSH